MTFNKCTVKGKVYGDVPDEGQHGRNSGLEEVILLLIFSRYIIN